MGMLFLLARLMLIFVTCVNIMYNLVWTEAHAIIYLSSDVALLY